MQPSTLVELLATLSICPSAGFVQTFCFQAVKEVKRSCHRISHLLFWSAYIRVLKLAERMEYFSVCKPRTFSIIAWLLSTGLFFYSMSAGKSFLRSLPVMLCDREGKNSRDVESIPAFKVIVSWELKCAHIVMPWETFTLSSQMTTIPWSFWRFQKNNYCIKVSVNLLWNIFWKRGSLALKNGLFLLLPLPQLC